MDGCYTGHLPVSTVFLVFSVLKKDDPRKLPRFLAYCFLFGLASEKYRQEIGEWARKRSQVLTYTPPILGAESSPFSTLPVGHPLEPDSNK